MYDIALNGVTYYLLMWREKTKLTSRRTQIHEPSDISRTETCAPNFESNIRELKQATFCEHGRQMEDWIKNCVCVSLW